MMIEEQIRIPKRIQIETFFGCNAKCVMCFVGYPESNGDGVRKKGTMSMQMFNSVIDSMLPYKDHIEKVDLFGLGEPLLDRHLFERIKYLKEKGFQNIAISTNADLLNVEKQKLLLESGIDTVIFSIDGIKKETHENIRKGVLFERLVDNCQNMIAMRDQGNYKTRFVIRFIRQPSNLKEWASFKQFWQSKISFEKKDMLIVYDVNTMGGTFLSKEELISEGRILPEIEERQCHMVFDRLIILNDGSVPLCCEDTPRATYNFGNVNNQLPIKIFNSPKFNRIRELHQSGEKNKMPICKDCVMLYSEQTTQVFDKDNFN